MANAKYLSGPLAVCAAGALAMALAMGIGRFAFTPMLPLMIRDAQIDVAGGGWVAAANYVGYLLGAMTASRIAWSATRLGTVALLLTAALTAAMALPGSLWLWMGLRFAAGVCSAWAFISTSIWCLGALAQLRRPSWGSGVYAGVGAGIALAGVFCLAGATAGASAPALWLQLGLLALAMTLPIVAVAARIGPESSPRAGGAGRAAPPPRGTAGLVISYGVFGFGYILPATFLPVLARSVVDDPRLFGLAWPVFGSMAVLSTFAAGWIARHASRLRVWAAAHFLMGVGVLLPSLWLNGPMIALAALLVGGTFMVVTMTAVQESRARAPDNPTPFLSRMTAGFAIGQIAGPVASSLLLYLPARFNGLNLALQAAAAGLMLSALWLWRQHRAPSFAKEVSHAR
jgi:predicted MFS family arabinose efflux permease